VAQPCSVCSHPDATLINQALIIERQSNRAITRQYDLSKDAVRRHREHVPQLLVKASQAMEVANADALLDRIEDLYAEAKGVLEAGKGESDHRLVLMAIDRAGKQLETLAEMRGELNRQPQVNVALVHHPDYARLREAILVALEPHPEARWAVAAALRGVE
jgi:hypothetical protein